MRHAGSIPSLAKAGRVLSERFVLGVDGGNTKTIAAIADLDGQIVGVGRGGCSDIYAVGSADTALGEIGAVIDAARCTAGVRLEDLAASAYSLAGADWPEDIEFLRASVAVLGGGRIVVVNDAMGALRAGSADGSGVAVVCGTGAAIGARGKDGRTWHTSWWQEPQGSRHLAEKAMRAVYRAELGIEPATTLTDRVLQLYGEHTVEAVLHRLTARVCRSDVNYPAITCALLDEAELGDRTATRIVREHGRSLGDYAVAAATHIDLDQSNFALVLTGGVFRHTGNVLPNAIVDRVRETYPEARLLVSRDEPVVGAVLLALEAAGISIDGAVMSRLRASYPSVPANPVEERLGAGGPAQ
jgi:N-acetylglucosamine kinase-like BadF-type ATPase